MDRKVEHIYAQMQSSLEYNQIFNDEKSFSCIFKVPESLLEINKEAYQPQIVSMGPYHHGTPIRGKNLASDPYREGKDLPMIREQKWRYLNGLLKEMRKEKRTNKPLKYLLNRIVSKEKEIRQSYSETISNMSDDLAMMMVLDGVFLIELFRKYGNINHESQNDPIFKLVWVLPFLMRDFLMIENQIPFFVLEALFEESGTEKDVCTLPFLILEFFNYGALRPKKEYDNLNLKGKHLLDFFRKSFLIKKPDASIGNGTPGHVDDRPDQELDTSTERIPPAKTHLPETAALTGNETSGDTSIEVIEPPKMHLKGTDAITGNDRPNQELDTSTERIQPEKTHLSEIVAGNETSDETSIEITEPPKMHLKGTDAITGNETSDDGTSNRIIIMSQAEKLRTRRAMGTRYGRQTDTTARYGKQAYGVWTTAARYGKNTRIRGAQPVKMQLNDTVESTGKMHPKETVADNRTFERIQPATKLVVAGVKFKKNDEAKSFLDIKFQKGVLLIPQINLDDFYTHFILNGMIFEQCYSDSDSDFSRDITTYIMFLGCLINTSMDVGLLSDKKIIQNYLGTDKELVKFFNNVVKYVAFDVKDNYLLDVFKQINHYCDNGLHVGWAGFKHTYFDSPWTAISAFAAFVLLCLTVAQTFYTVYPYYYERI